jgi:hypothetical protein
MAAYMVSVRKLDDPIHFQSIAAAARSVFELGLDIALIGADTTNEAVDRLTAFTQVERYRVAQRVVDFYATRSLPANFNITREREVCADATKTAEVEGLVQNYWGRTRNGALNWPSHWSRFSDARGRARQVGPNWEERYVRHYYMLSWHVHSGEVGTTGLRQDVFDAFVGDAHCLIRDSVIDSYAVLGHELHLTQAVDDWVNRLDFLRRVSGFALVDQRLQALGETSRFLYLEEHELKI